MSTRFKYGVANNGDLSHVSEMDTIDEAAATVDDEKGDRLAFWQDGQWLFYND